ncbi:hypothetical protein MBLNU457_g0058t1 [Dothideomycetes sp. NU457]
MSPSPQPEQEVDQQEQTPEDNDPNAEKDMNRPEDDPNFGYDFEVKEQDRWLPIANVARIMKGALPDNAKIAKEAKECMQECVSEFISFITSEASEKCQQEKRKTVNGEDIIFAMTSLGFENYSEALKIYLARYRESLIARGDQKGPQPGPGPAMVNTTDAYATNPALLSNSGIEGTEAGGEYPYTVGHNAGAEYQ